MNFGNEAFEEDLKLPERGRGRGRVNVNNETKTPRPRPGQSGQSNSNKPTISRQNSRNEDNRSRENSRNVNPNPQFRSRSSSVGQRQRSGSFSENNQRNQMPGSYIPQQQRQGFQNQPPPFLNFPLPGFQGQRQENRQENPEQQGRPRFQKQNKKIGNNPNSSRNIANVLLRASGVFDEISAIYVDKHREPIEGQVSIMNSRGIIIGAIKEKKCPSNIHGKDFYKKNVDNSNVFDVRKSIFTESFLRTIVLFNEFCNRVSLKKHEDISSGIISFNLSNKDGYLKGKYTFTKTVQSIVLKPPTFYVVNLLTSLNSFIRNHENPDENPIQVNDVYESIFHIQNKDIELNNESGKKFLKDKILAFKGVLKTYETAIYEEFLKSLDLLKDNLKEENRERWFLDFLLSETAFKDLLKNIVKIKDEEIDDMVKKTINAIRYEMIKIFEDFFKKSISEEFDNPTINDLEREIVNLVDSMFSSDYYNKNGDKYEGKGLENFNEERMRIENHLIFDNDPNNPFVDFYESNKKRVENLIKDLNMTLIKKRDMAKELKDLSERLNLEYKDCILKRFKKSLEKFNVKNFSQIDLERIFPKISMSTAGTEEQKYRTRFNVLILPIFRNCFERFDTIVSDIHKELDDFKTLDHFDSVYKIHDNKVKEFIGKGIGDLVKLEGGEDLGGFEINDDDI